LNRADLVRHQRDDGDGVAVQRGELDFVTCRVPMHEHDCADVAGVQTVLRQVARKNHVIQFFDHWSKRLGEAEAGAAEDSRRHSRFIPQHEQFIPAQFRERDGSPVRIEELHVERFRRVNLDDRADLAGDKALSRLVLKESHDIEQFDRRILHENFISRSR